MLLHGLRLFLLWVWKGLLMSMAGISAWGKVRTITAATPFWHGMVGQWSRTLPGATRCLRSIYIKERVKVP